MIKESNAPHVGSHFSPFTTQPSNHPKTAGGELSAVTVHLPERTPITFSTLKSHSCLATRTYSPVRPLGANPGQGSVALGAAGTWTAHTERFTIWMDKPEEVLKSQSVKWG